MMSEEEDTDEFIQQYLEQNGLHSPSTGESSSKKVAEKTKTEPSGKGLKIGREEIKKNFDVGAVLPRYLTLDAKDNLRTEIDRQVLGRFISGWRVASIARDMNMRVAQVNRIIQSPEAQRLFEQAQKMYEDELFMMYGQLVENVHNLAHSDNVKDQKEAVHLWKVLNEHRPSKSKKDEQPQVQVNVNMGAREKLLHQLSNDPDVREVVEAEYQEVTEDG